MADWSDYYSGQRVDSLASFVALRHHDARVGGSVPGLGSFNTVTHIYFFGSDTKLKTQPLLNPLTPIAIMKPMFYVL